MWSMDYKPIGYTGKEPVRGVFPYRLTLCPIIKGPGNRGLQAANGPLCADSFAERTENLHKFIRVSH